MIELKRSLLASLLVPAALLACGEDGDVREGQIATECAGAKCDDLNEDGDESDEGPEGVIRFVALGDMPYNEGEYVEWASSIEDPLAMSAGDLAFVLHFGDYRGQYNCDGPNNSALLPPEEDPARVTFRNTDQFFEEWMDSTEALGLPVFYTPGDNEWSDCDVALLFPKQITGTIIEYLDQPVSALWRLAEIRRRFFVERTHHGAAQQRREVYEAESQASQPENQLWVVTEKNEAGEDKTVVFGTIHLVGSRNGRMNARFGTDWHPDSVGFNAKQWRDAYPDGIKVDPAPDSVEDQQREAAVRDENNLEWLDYVFETADRLDASAVVIGTQADIGGEITDVPCTDDDVIDLYHSCNVYADTRVALQEHAGAFGKPVLLAHGDTADYCVETEFLGLPNLTRYNGPGDTALLDLGLVTISLGRSDAEVAFDFTTVETGTEPEACGEPEPPCSLTGPQKPQCAYQPPPSLCCEDLEDCPPLQDPDFGDRPIDPSFHCE